MAMCSLGLNAQETLTVGDGTDINYRVPYYCYWGSMTQHSQIVYNESMLSGMEGYEITGITFYVNQGVSDIGNVAVTLGQTTSSAMNGQWLPMTNSAVVYDGDVAIEGSLLTITFTTPYAYNGGNLVVDLNYYTWVYNTSTVTWLGVNDASMGDISAADMYFEGAPQETYSFLPKTTFTYSENSCQPANNLTLVSIDTTEVSLAWTASPTALSYNVTVGDSTYNTSDLSITINSLQPDSIYTVSLQAVCEDNALSQARTITFRTPIAPAEVPYSTGFEAEDDVAWQTLNDTSAWYIGNATGDNSSNSLYISADGGVSLGCSLLDHNDAYAYRTFHLTSAGQYRLDYRWRVNADVYYDYGRAYIAPAGTVVEAGTQPGTNSAMSFTPDGWINAGSLPLRNETSWHSDSCIFNITSSDTLITLIFLWHNEPYGNGTSSIAIDNISLVKLPCPTITSLNLESTTASTATFSWDNTHYIYELEARIGDSVHASATVYDETSATLTGLSIDNDYEVYLRGVCDASNDEYTAWYGPVITHIGYCQPTPDNVDGQGIVEVSYGTALVATNTDHPTTAPYYANYHNVVGIANPGDMMPVDITYSTRFASGAVYDYGTIIWIDWNHDLEFQGTEVVYVGESDTTEPSTVHAEVYIPTSAPLGTYRMRIAGASTGFDSYINSIADAANANPCFSFSWAVAHDYTVRIASATTCPNVDSVVVDSIGDRFVSLSWPAAADSGATYTVTLGADTLATNIEGTDYAIDGLEPNTRYTFVVSTNCADSSSSYGVNVTVTTNCGVIDILPWSEDFSSVDALRCWTTLDLDGVATSNWYRQQFGEVRSNFSNDGPANDWLITPPIAIDANYDAVHLAWDAHGNHDQNTLTGERYDAHLTVLLSSAGTTAATFVDTLASGILPVDWQHFSVPLDEYIGQTVHIAFVHDSYFDMGPVVDNVTIAPGSVCAAPTMVQVTEVNTEDLSIAFNGIEGEQYYAVIANDSAVLDSGATSINAYTFYGLEPSTAYTIRVGRLCGEEVIQAYPIMAHTAMSATELPYSTGFDSIETVAWHTASGAYGWFIGTDTAASGSTHSLYISADSGATRGYTVATEPSNYAYKCFEVPAGQYSVGYDWMCEGLNNIAYMRVFLAPVGAVLADGITNGISHSHTPEGWIALDGGHALGGAAEWQYAYHTFDVATAGLYYLVFYWNSGLVGTATTPAVVDNVTFAPLTCTAPTDLVFDSIESDAVSLSWTAAEGSTQWLVSVDNGAWQPVSATSFTATGLAAGDMHTFAVRTYCGVGDTSFALSGTFRTNCADSPIPWGENFDTMTTTAYASPMTCWNVLGQGFVNAVPFAGYGQVLQFSPNMTSAPVVAAVLPPFDTPLNELQMTYIHAPEQQFSGTFSVGYITNVADSTTFTALKTYTGNSFTFDGGIIFYFDTVDFANAPADARIAFRYIYPGYPGIVDWYWLIDNVVVAPPAEEEIYSVVVTSADPAMGSVSPDGVTMVYAGNTFTASATPRPGYRFKGWSIAPGYTSPVYDNPVTITVNSDMTLVAGFEIDHSGIAVADGLAHLVLAPNPASGMVRLEGLTADAWLTVCDRSGREVMRTVATSDDATLDISHLAAGAYFVRVTSAEGTAVLKLVVR